MIWWVGLALLSFMVAGAIGSGRIREFYFISDMLYLPTLVADLTLWHGHMRDWRLTPAPYLFPDLLFYLTARAIAQSVEAAQYLAGALQFFGILLAARYAVRAALPPGFRSRAGMVSLCFAGTVGLLWVKLPDAAPWFVVSLHGGAALSSLVACALLLRGAFSVWWRTGGLFVLSVATTASDPLFLVSFAAPVLLIAAAPLALDAVAARRPAVHPGAASSLLGPVACFVGSVVGGAVVRSLSKDTTGRYLHPRLQTAGRAWEALVTDATRDATPAFALLASLTVVSALALTSRRGRSHSAPGSLVALSVLSTFATLAATLLTGRYQQGCFRYFATALTLNVVSSTALAARWMPARVFAAIPAASLLLCMVYAGATYPAWWSGQFRSDVRSGVSCLEQVCQREGVSLVLSDYWHEKPSNLFAAADQTVLAIDSDDLRPRWWINNRSWYLRPGEPGVVIANGLSETRLAETFGPPSATVQCEDLRLYVYRGEQRGRMHQWVRDGAQSFF